MSCDILVDEGGQLLLNGKPVRRAGKWERITDWIESDTVEMSLCPYCRTKVASYRTNEIGEDEQTWSENLFVMECPRCAYWQGFWYYDAGICSGSPMDLPECEAQIGKLAEFPDELPKGCATEMARFMRAHPDYWHEITPKQMEMFVADIYRANHAAGEVLHIGKPHDGGIDVLFIDTNERKWLIQVKRREHDKAVESVTTVRNLLGVLLLEEAKHGVVVSTADHFSYRAHEAKVIAQRMGYTIDLVDRGRLDRMLTPCLPVMPWADLVQRRKPEIIREIVARFPDRRQLTFRDWLNQIGQE